MRYQTLSLIVGLIIVITPGKSKEMKDEATGLLSGIKMDGYKWIEHTKNAAFPKSYNFQLFTIRDTLWAFHSVGNWYSINGKDWTMSRLTNSINNLGFLDYVFFNNAIYGLGHFEGNIEQHSLASTISRSTDLKSWTVLAQTSNLPRRFFYHPFVFQNKIWIIGGADETNHYADAWNSVDGVLWKKVADNLPFGKRENSQFVLFNNKLYLLNNDVWSSFDGIHWNQETKEIVKGQEIFGYASVVFDNKIWLMGCNRNNVFKSELLVSNDGIKWSAERAPWSPRGGMTTSIFKGKLFMTGGKYGGPGIAGQTEFVYSNDVWSLEKG